MRLKIPNPVVSEELRLDCLYVDPDIKVLRETTDPGRGLVNVEDKPTLANVSQCRHLFYTKEYKCRQIYITGDAGLGKSMFCKHLVDMWCKADTEIVTSTEDSHSEFSNYEFGDSGFMHNLLKFCYEQKLFIEKKRMEEDRKIISEFKLLFYITLRESPNQYHVADMIDYQILQQDEEMQHLKASALLKQVPCLVIIDGLDEWACPMDAKVPPFVKPGIPGRDCLNKNNVFLTTTRPWKFDVLQLTSSEVDKHVELVGFNSDSSDKLCFNIINLLEYKERVQRTKRKFQTELQEKGLSHLRKIPVILTQLICLWFDKQYLGPSQLQLYCSMLEMLLKRADKNLIKPIFASTTETVRKEMLLPGCFSNHRHCQTHQHLLVVLCKVAFEALFNQKREHALVFESSQMEISGVDQINVDLCLKSGILSQKKVLGKWSVSEKKLSFLHKTLQEFLAAIYICENAENVISHVKHFCTTVESMLEMSQVWMFVSGVRPDLAKQLLTDLMIDVVLKNTSLQKVRHTLTVEHRGPALVRYIQKCIVDCVVEARSNGHIDLCLPLEDFVIDELTVSTCLESLFTFNKANIRSVIFYETDGVMPDTVARCKLLYDNIICQLQDARCLQKLYLDNTSVRTNMKHLCQTLDNNKNNLKCLELKCITLTTALSGAVCSAINDVKALRLSLDMSHEQKQQLFSSVSQARHIRELRLDGLYCTTHAYQCKNMTLFGHTQLLTLHLWNMFIEHMPAVTHCLKFVELFSVTITERELRKFIQELSSNSHTLRGRLLDVTVTGDSEGRVDLTDLRHNDNLVITNIGPGVEEDSWNIEFLVWQ